MTCFLYPCTTTVNQLCKLNLCTHFAWCSALSPNLDKFKGRTFNIGERLRHISTLPSFLLLLASMIVLVVFHSGRWLCSKRDLQEIQREHKPDFHVELCNGLKSYDIAENPKYSKVTYCHLSRFPMLYADNAVYVCDTVPAVLSVFLSQPYMLLSIAPQQGKHMCYGCVFQ